MIPADHPADVARQLYDSLRGMGVSFYLDGGSHVRYHLQPGFLLTLPALHQIERVEAELRELILDDERRVQTKLEYLRSIVAGGSLGGPKDGE